MSIQLLSELESELYEDLEPRIFRLEETNQGIAIYLRATDWRDRTTKREFIIVCSNIRESKVVLGGIGYLKISHDHPIMLDYNSPLGSLFFSSAPQDPHEIIEICRGVKADFYKQCDSHSFIQCSANALKSGNGLLANGPIALLLRIQEYLGSKMKTNIVSNASLAVQNSELKMLSFEDSYVICETLDTIEI